MRGRRRNVEFVLFFGLSLSLGLLASYKQRFVDPGETKTKYSIVIGGENFVCGSSQEHAPVCLGAAGAKAVVASLSSDLGLLNKISLTLQPRFDSTQLFEPDMLAFSGCYYGGGDKERAELAAIRMRRTPTISKSTPKFNSLVLSLHTIHLVLSFYVMN